MVWYQCAHQMVGRKVNTHISQKCQTDFICFFQPCNVEVKHKYLLQCVNQLVRHHYSVYILTLLW